MSRLVIESIKDIGLAFHELPQKFVEIRGANPFGQEGFLFLQKCKDFFGMNQVGGKDGGRRTPIETKISQFGTFPLGGGRGGVCLLWRPFGFYYEALFDERLNPSFLEG